MSDDGNLLRRYSTSRSKGDFAEIVQRHLGLVYHTALRRVDGDVHLAEDITQDIFLTLARNARSLGKHPALIGWLYVATRNAAANVARRERRRRVREQEAQAMNRESDGRDAQLSWDRVRPELERVLDALPAKDRAAVLLRFYEGRPFADIGASLRLSENAARMRVDRALDRLRSLLERRGIQSTSAALAGLLCQEAATAAPAGLAASVTNTAVAGAAMAPATVISTFSIFTAMNTSKIIVGLSGVIACASLGTAVFQHAASREAKAALGTAITDRDAMRQKLEAALAASEAARADAESALAKTAALEKELQERSAKQAEPVKRPSHAAARPTAAMTNEFAVLMKDPAYQQAWLEYNRAGYRQRYGRLYRKLHLSPDQIATFEATLQELDLASADTIAAAQSQGVSLDDPIMQRVPSNIAMRDAATRLRTLLGESGHAEFLAFQSEAQINGTVDAFAGNLYYTDAPLTADQADRLTGLIRAHTKAGPKSGMMWTGPQVDWSAVVEQSRGLLAAPQLEVLRRTVEQNEFGSRMNEIRQSIMASMLAEAAQKPPTGGE